MRLSKLTGKGRLACDRSAFYIQLSELSLSFQYPSGERVLSFEQWRAACRLKLAALLGFERSQVGTVYQLRTTQVSNLQIQALVMCMGSQLTLE